MSRDADKSPGRVHDGRVFTALDYFGYTLRRFYDDGLMQSVGALTYTTLLALVPMLVIAFAIFSAFPAFDMAQERFQAIIFESIVPETGEDIRAYLDRFASNARELTAAGVVALAFSAVLLLFTIEATLNRVWHARRKRPLLTRLLVFWTLLTLGPLLVAASLAVSGDLFVFLDDWTGEAAGGGTVPDWLRPVFAILFQSAIFTAVFRLVPASPVRLADAAIGGVIAGIGFEILTLGFGALVVNNTTYSTVYGAVSAVPIFLIWTYCCWSVVVLGAVFAASLPDWRRDRRLPDAEDFGPTRVLMAAVAVLGRVARNARDGGGATDFQSVADVAPLHVRETLLERLIDRNYLVMTSEGEIALSRDLHRTTLSELAHDLDLTLGSGRERSDAMGPLEGLLSRLGEAEDDILGRPLEEFTGGRGGDGPDRPRETR